jgi:hypothetical protein
MTCGTVLTGNFCANCGEKKLNPSKDYSIGKFLEQTVDGFTHFDSKFLRSFKALLFKPGFLTLEFINGRKTRYMKPVQIFIISSVLLYFIFPSNATFFHPIQYMGKGVNLIKFDGTTAIKKKAEADSTSTHVIIKQGNTEAAHKSKAFLFLLIPFWGFLFYLLFYKALPWIVPHLIFVTHLLSFLIILFIVHLTIARLFNLSDLGDEALVPLIALFATYLFIAIRKTYQRGVLRTALSWAISLVAFFYLFIFYRQAITAWVLSS